MPCRPRQAMFKGTKSLPFSKHNSASLIDFEKRFCQGTHRRLRLIEFALFTALGFLAAGLLVLIIAPALYRRMVKLTERRVRTNAHFDAVESQANRDIERAEFAAENSKISVQLKQERQELAQTVASKSRLSETLTKMRNENAGLQQNLESLKNETRDLRTGLKREEKALEQAKQALSQAQEQNSKKEQQIKSLIDRANRLETEIGAGKIDLASKDTESENLRTIIDKLRDEQLRLANDQLQLEHRVANLQAELDQERTRAKDFEKRLETSQKKLENRDKRLETKALEIKTLKEKMGVVRSESTALRRSLKASESDRKALERELNKVEKQLSKFTGETPKQHKRAEIEIPKPVRIKSELVNKNANDDAVDQAVAGSKSAQNLSLPKSPEAKQPRSAQSISQRVDKLRARHNRLVEQLNKPASPSKDADYRAELSHIAAMMVDLVAVREGETSNVHDLLATNNRSNKKNKKRRSLANRAQDLIDQSQELVN